MYNSISHSVTGKPPGELFYGRQFRDKIPSLVDLEDKIQCEVIDGETCVSLLLPNPGKH